MTGFSDLLGGYRRFRDTGWSTQHERWAELRDGQSPKVMVIACSDSRVDPAQIFDTSPGETFVVRNVANLVPPFEADGGRHGVSAALEFAVTQLEVPEFIAHWMDLLDEGRARVLAEHGDGPEAVRALELETVRVSIANLRTFPFVAEREASGMLTIHGAYFAIADGILHVMRPDGDFATA
jgi:carbonic anhydrase